MTELNRLNAVEAARRIANGEMSSEALVSACIERIRDREDAVRAWEYFEPEPALAQAGALDRRETRGLLHGVPVGIKDVVDTADMPTGYGSAVYRDFRPPWDASCVSLIRASGGVVLGKTVTAELATFSPGKTTNPHNPVHTPGGSSSGSAAAVADYMVPLAIGTQTAGSVIRPASYCGVVGYKPSYGWISRVGVKMVSDTLDTLGVFARTVEDTALLGAVLTGRKELLAARPFHAPPRIGFCRTYEWPHASDESVSAFEGAWKMLEEAGAETTDIHLPETFAPLAAMQAEIMAYEAARSLAYEYRAHRDRLSPKLQDLIRAGQSIPVRSYDAALKHAVKCRRRFQKLFKDIDIIITPSVPGEAPEGLASTGDPIFNRVWTLLGVPCVNIPAFSGPRGLPVGIQAVGRYRDDHRTLASAGWVMQILKPQ